jgi:rhodanese-related sulfurtransferase
LAADALMQMGYTNVTSMDGGIKAWRQAGYPMES